jgi:hypothetical protein
MQLLEIIDYGPNTFGARKQSGENSEIFRETFRWRRKNSPKTPLPAPHIAGAKKGEKKTNKKIGRFFAGKLFSEEVRCF